jgi:hypothetical protein
MMGELCSFLPIGAFSTVSIAIRSRRSPFSQSETWPRIIPAIRETGHFSTRTEFWRSTGSTSGFPQWASGGEPGIVRKWAGHGLDEYIPGLTNKEKPPYDDRKGSM